VALLLSDDLGDLVVEAHRGAQARLGIVAPEDAGSRLLFRADGAVPGPEGLDLLVSDGVRLAVEGRRGGRPGLGGALDDEGGDPAPVRGQGCRGATGPAEIGPAGRRRRTEPAARPHRPANRRGPAPPGCSGRRCCPPPPPRWPG